MFQEGFMKDMYLLTLLGLIASSSSFYVKEVSLDSESCYFSSKTLNISSGKSFTASGSICSLPTMTESSSYSYLKLILV